MSNVARGIFCTFSLFFMLLNASIIFVPLIPVQIISMLGCDYMYKSISRCVMIVITAYTIADVTLKSFRVQ
jgi:hypothetical protein